MRFFNWLIISLIVIGNCNATSHHNPEKTVLDNIKVKRIGNNLFEGSKGAISIIIKTFHCYEYEEDNKYGYKLIKDKGLILKFPNEDACAVDQIFKKVDMDKILESGAKTE